MAVTPTPKKVVRSQHQEEGEVSLDSDDDRKVRAKNVDNAETSGEEEDDEEDKGKLTGPRRKILKQTIYSTLKKRMRVKKSPGMRTS